MRTVFILLSFVAVIQSNNSYSQKNIALPKSKLITASEPYSQQCEMVDIELFMDNLLQKDVVFSDEKIEAGQVWLWNKKRGPRPKEPNSIEFENKQYKLKKAYVVFGKDRLKEGIYDIDSAMKFSIKGKEFYLARGYYHNCNGSGCEYWIYFLLDKQRERLHIFEMFRQPVFQFLGDINNDGELDIVIQDFLITPGYNEKNKVLSLYPYTLNERGHFVRMKNINGDECFLVGECDSPRYPEKFRVVGYNCLSLEIRPD